MGYVLFDISFRQSLDDTDRIEARKCSIDDTKVSRPKTFMLTTAYSLEWHNFMDGPTAVHLASYSCCIMYGNTV